MIAFDANMCPEDFKKNHWFQSRHMFIETPGAGISTCRSKGPNGAVTEITCDYVIARQSLQGKINNMEVVASQGGHFLGRDKEFQVWRKQKMPNAQPGFSGGKLSGRNKVEGGEEDGA